MPRKVKPVVSAMSMVSSVKKALSIMNPCLLDIVLGILELLR